VLGAAGNPASVVATATTPNNGINAVLAPAGLTATVTGAPSTLPVIAGGPVGNVLNSVGTPGVTDSLVNANANSKQVLGGSSNPLVNGNVVSPGSSTGAVNANVLNGSGNVASASVVPANVGTTTTLGNGVTGTVTNVSNRLLGR
jgi:hypothetical protein